MNTAVYAVAVVACGAGALARYLLTTVRGTWSWPWPTLIANVVGSMVLGAIAHIALTSAHPDELLLIAGAGFAGGLTTFSTLAVDAVMLWRKDRRIASAGYLATTFATGLVAASLGWALVGLL